MTAHRQEVLDRQELILLDAGRNELGGDDLDDQPRIEVGAWFVWVTVLVCQNITQTDQISDN
jgi:hypothetical protein